MSQHNSVLRNGSLHLGSGHEAFFSKEQWQNVEENRLNFLKNGVLLPKESFVSDEIFASWERSRHSGVDAESTLLRIKISDEEFQNAYDTYEYMLKYIKPHIEITDDMGMGADYIIEVMSDNGVSLFQAGNRELHDQVGEKCIFNESTMGTNAHSLCMRYRKPFSIVGAEHYCQALLGIAAVAAPIIDSERSTVASLLFSWPLTSEPWSMENQKLLLHAMSLIVNVSTAVETDLRYQQCHTHMIELEHEIEKLTPSKQGVQRQASDSISVGGDEFNPLDINASRNDIHQPGHQTNKHRDPAQSTHENVGDVATITFDDILGQSPSTRQAVELAKRFAKTRENILIIGESGTGKEYFAQAVHNNLCPDGPFMSINCAAIPPRLIESELFGYESGTFTGAQRGGKAGKIELAQGGTLFLDEIGDMPLELQATLLRVLENKRVMRLGGKSYKQVNFRVIAATNRELLEMVENGHFREDLYYRLSTLSIELTPLRERPEDLDFFIRYYLDDFLAKNGLRRRFSTQAAIIIREFSWPGNVRQLKNAILSSCYAAQDEVITVADLPPFLGAHKPIAQTTDFSLRHLEESAIKNALSLTEYNVTKAADMLDISRATLYRKLKEYNLASGFPDIV